RPLPFSRPPITPPATLPTRPPTGMGADHVCSPFLATGRGRPPAQRSTPPALLRDNPHTTIASLALAGCRRPALHCELVDSSHRLERFPCRADHHTTAL